MAESTLRINKVCPRCFSEKGNSIVMFEDKGNWLCPKDSRHVFKMDKDGFMQIVKAAW